MLKLTIVTPSKRLLVDVPVDEVFAPAELGEVNLLAGHAPLLTTLTTGVLKYKKQGDTKLTQVVISWGFCEVVNDKVNILAETAEKEEEIDKERARLAYQEAQKRLSDAGLGGSELEKAQRKLARAEVRMNLNH
ncbi:MAG: ATP synthase F1 subunit epsilon [Bdellovibrionales bacterium]|nr:ATP synthase F1 subunit epsilon [Bdellovibrionales bacterium]